MKTSLIFLFVIILCGATIFISTTDLRSQTSRGMKISVRTNAGEHIELYNASYALVIGNGNYTNGWDPLPGALQDVKEVAEALKTHDFNVTLKTDLTADEFEDAFLKFVLEHGADENNRLLFYYAGHGYTLPLANAQERGYLVMVDAPEPDIDKLGFVRESVNMETLVGESKAILARHVLFLFDCCFSGTILNARDRVRPESISDNIRHPVRQFITAGRANEPVPDRSVFKTAFLDLIDGRAAEPFRDGYITGEELGLYLKNQVPIYNEAQHPQYGKIRDPKLDKGDFVFVLPQRNTAELPTLATLHITSTPSGATVYLNGAAVGKTPLQNHEIDTGLRREKQVEIGLELSDHKSRVKIFTVTGGQNVPWDVPLEQILVPKIIEPKITEMVLIPGGEFRMGNRKGHKAYGGYLGHTVHVDAFYIDKYEVTNTQFKAFVDANPQWQKDNIPDKYHDGGYLSHWTGNSYPSGKGDHPVEHVSWYAAMAYAQWVGKRLPTEAEWEKAARGGLVGKEYPWGNNFDANQLNDADDTTPVGRYAPNGYGLYDMARNVGEWCLDERDASYSYGRSQRRNPLAGEMTLTEVMTNYQNVTTDRVTRGGGRYISVVPANVANRFWGSPTNSDKRNGFRCAKKDTNPPPPQSAAVPNQENVVFKLTDGELIAKSDIESLRDEDLGPITLRNLKDELIEVTTCREYDSAHQRGYHPYTRLESAMAIDWEQQCGLLDSLQEATTPQQSFISNPRVGVADLELLPFSLFSYPGDDDDNVEDLTYQTAVDTGRLVVEDVGQDFLKIQSVWVEIGGERMEGDEVQSLREVVRADFNGDGIEDVLLFETGWWNGGFSPWPIGGIIVLTRESRDGKFEVIYQQQ